MKKGKNEITTVTNWQGSLKTKETVEKQIKARWGEKAAAIYDPQRNCRTYKGWKMVGYQVKKGETSIKSWTMIKKEDKKEKKEYKFVKPCNLFYIKQVKKIKRNGNQRI